MMMILYPAIHAHGLTEAAVRAGCPIICTKECVCGVWKEKAYTFNPVMIVCYLMVWWWW